MLSSFPPRNANRLPTVGVAATSQIAKLRPNPGNLEPTRVSIVAMENTVEKLVATDRCDVCGAQAYIRVELEIGELLFCAHHGNANKEKLQPISINWHDQSSELSQR